MGSEEAMIHCAKCGQEFPGIIGVKCEDCRELEAKEQVLRSPPEPRVTGPGLLPPDEDE